MNYVGLNFSKSKYSSQNLNRQLFRILDKLSILPENLARIKNFMMVT